MKNSNEAALAQSAGRGSWKHALALGVLLLGGALLLGSPPAPAQASRSLNSVDFVALDGNRVRFTFTLSDSAPEPVIFTIDNPPRLSMDLAETRLALGERLKRVNVGAARTVAAAEAGGRTRVVVELTEPVGYTTTVDGNRVILELGGSTISTAPASPGMGGVAAVDSQIVNVDFRRGDKGEGRVLVTLTDPRTAVDVREEGGKVVARFRNSAVAEQLVRRLDVVDFATPVKYVDTRRDGAHTEITVTAAAGADFEQVAYQSGNLFTLELQPIPDAQLEERRREAPVYSGERISLSFQSVDVRALLQIIADVAGTNMVVSDSVTGDIALRLQNVPWDQALDIILRTKGLGMRQEGNVMLVAPLAELAARDKLELEALQQQVELAPLRSEIIQVNYAKAQDLASLLQSEGGAMISERGRVTVDERTNTLLVLETREKLAEIRELVARLDIPVRQVLIESRIVVANDDFVRDLGTRFGVTTLGSLGEALIGTSGSIDGSRRIIGIDPTNDPEDATENPNTVPGFSQGLNVNLPAGNAGAGRFGISILGPNYLLDLELSALQSEGRGEVISTPRVITANAKQARIEQGREIPFQESTSSGATAIQFKKAVLSLTVTPQITPDDRVIMDLEVTNDTQGQDVNTGNGGTAPAIDTRRINTQVLVDDGQTVVLGGVFEQTFRQSVDKIPFLGDIPLIGAFFRNTNKTNNKRELLIFITPKLLKEDLRVN